MYLYQFCLLLVAVPLVACATYELENGQLSGGAFVGNTADGFLGSGYVDGLFNDGDKVTFTVNVPATGLYQVDLRFRSPYGSKGTNIYVNGNWFLQPMLPTSTLWTQFAVPQKVPLNAGDNTIAFEKGWGYYQLDQLDVNVPPPARSEFTLGTNVDPNANTAAKKLLTYLQDNWGKYIISGQQSLPDSYGFFQNKLQKQPAIYGFDFMFYSPEAIQAQGDLGTDVDDAISWASKGGLVAFTWHWFSPAGANDKGCPWYSSFNTGCTSFNLRDALASKPNGANYNLLLRDIDAIADQLKRLQDANVPVLFRPLHEADGGWFWWGASGSAATVELYRLIFQRLTTYHNLHNLVWVWNVGRPEVSADWYPGNDVADVVSFDYYTNQQQAPFGQHSVQIPTYNLLAQISGKSKVIAMAENGAIPDIDAALASGANWSYFNTWSGDFLSGGQWNPLEFLQTVYNHPMVITWDDLPGYVAPIDSGIKTDKDEPVVGIHEMELGKLNGPVVKLAGFVNFTGTGYTDEWTGTNSGTVTLYNVVAGSYQIQLRVRSQFSEKHLLFSVNNGPQKELVAPQSATWMYISAGQYALPTQATVELTISAGWGYYQVDHILVSQAVQPAVGVHEMESGKLSGPVIATSLPGFTGDGYVDQWSGSGYGTITLLNVAAGKYRINVRARSEYDDKHSFLTVNNGESTEFVITKSTEWQTITVGDYTLPAKDSVDLTISAGWGYFQIDNLEVIALDTPAPPPAEALIGVHEMENAQLDGPTIASSITGFSGLGYVDSWSSSGSGVVTLANVVAGTYRLSLRARSEYGPKNFGLSINNGVLMEYTIPQSTGWAMLTIGDFTLPTQASLPLKITGGWGYFQIDYVLVDVSAPPTTSSTVAPSTSSSTVAPSTSSSTVAPSTSSTTKSSTVAPSTSSTTKSSTVAPSTSSTVTPTKTVSRIVIETATRTIPVTVSATKSASSTVSASSTKTVSDSATQTVSNTKTATGTVSATKSGTVTASSSTKKGTVSVTKTASSTVTASATKTVSGSATQTVSNTKTASESVSSTKSASSTASATATRGVLDIIIKTATVTKTA